MKNRPYLILINAMFWIFILGFLIHLIAFGYHVFPRNLKYGYGGWNNKNDSVWQLTTYGHIRISGLSCEPPTIIQSDSIGKSVKLRVYNSSIVAFYYSDFKKAFQDKAVLVILLQIIHDLCWLVITFQLMLIFTNLKRNKVFELSVIRRLRIIAIIIAIAPVLQKLRSYWFSKVIEQNIEIQGHTIGSQNTFNIIYESLLYGVLPAILILILAEIFKHGMLLKQENDLTI